MATPGLSTLRVELFPHSLPVSLDFYTSILRFTIARHEPDTSNPDLGYAHLHRSTISIGLATAAAVDYPEPARRLSCRLQFRDWPLAVELVLEVGDLDALKAEREWIRQQRWEVREGEDLKLQPWGLWDFRVRDPDGYFWRLTEWAEGGQGPRERTKETVLAEEAKGA